MLSSAGSRSSLYRCLQPPQRTKEYRTEKRFRQGEKCSKTPREHNLLTQDIGTEHEEEGDFSGVMYRTPLTQKAQIAFFSLQSSYAEKTPTPILSAYPSLVAGRLHPGCGIRGHGRLALSLA